MDEEADVRAVTAYLVRWVKWMVVVGIVVGFWVVVVKGMAWLFRRYEPWIVIVIGLYLFITAVLAFIGYDARDYGERRE